MSDTYIVREDSDDKRIHKLSIAQESVHLPAQPRGDTEAGSHRLTGKILNTLVWMDHVDMKKS